MDGLLMKLLVSPILVVLADALFPEVNFANLYQSVGVGFVLALAGFFLDRAILAPGSLWLTTAIDFIIGFLIVYGSIVFLPDAQISAMGAGFVAIFYGVAEYLQHTWLLRAIRSENT
ncbi:MULTISPECIES: DUF2512 family protein [Brevibacillus]|uniref:DUF2512 family protein n=1 Tax=Brevibacillus parabrevis TaxID=54914 RepID=A0A4Y3PG46_BREPA|nr:MULTISPECIES: DUF2512 family protein [Brevibacillus]NRQ53991.1 DUF2512 family protein [Brevibacillus sp. HD1.4A]KZE44611.1 hypothetical protein AV540_23540 [Brevibacillus parabrevis]MBU8713815.1 DUF2512 family protein [Brevibacillus parabrevis]MDH6350728.1 hypothetical protein [Brevibacillus sp. 1238]MDR4998225.1 DUF2512 family protein [Brevibacillus parabrevis]